MLKNLIIKRRWIKFDKKKKSKGGSNCKTKSIKKMIKKK